MREEELEGAPEACATGKIRLFVPWADLAEGGIVDLSAEQNHHLQHVMRRTPGEGVRLFDGKRGEWLAEITELGKRRAAARVGRQTRAQDTVPDLWLLFAPVKRGPVDFLVQKATELGVAALGPVMTRRTVAVRVKIERLVLNTVSAAEQCGRLSVPSTMAPRPLGDVLADWDPARALMFCDEAGAPPALEAMRALQPGPAAILIGPEGGFDPAERALLRSKPYVTPIGLGPRILRADTAGIAALTLYQAVLGDLGAEPG